MRPLDLLSQSSPEYCCRVLCPAIEVQKRINRMQRAIDTAHQLLNSDDLSQNIIDELKEELLNLSSS